MGSNPEPTRYVVSKRNTGLGDCLVSLIAAWGYAKRTGRTLIADWRFSRYLARPKENAFDYFFEPPGEIGGVPVIGDDRIGRLRLPAPYFPAYWTPRRIHRLARRAPQEMTRSEDEATDLVRSKADVPARTVVFDACMSTARPSDDEARLFLRALQPRRRLQSKIDEYWNRGLAGRTVIGVHVRHGNGGNIMNHGAFWNDELAALTACAETALGVRKVLGPECALFLCTDSRAVQDLLSAMIPGVVTRAKHFAPVGGGELHDRSVGHLGTDDALVEMYLLARCHVLVRYPPASYFSHLARLTKPPLGPVTPAIERGLAKLGDRTCGGVRAGVFW